MVFANTCLLNKSSFKKQFFNNNKKFSLKQMMLPMSSANAKNAKTLIMETLHFGNGSKFLALCRFK